MRLVIYGLVVLVGIGLAVYLRQARYDDSSVPAWIYVVAIVVAAASIAIDVRMRRRGRSDDPR
ncbi:MAG TPA: hypothetical protein VLA97_17610 [Nocardioidaceae bacterium]|nr:hypothetical protein [Nocardioidaceae bacterium]